MEEKFNGLFAKEAEYKNLSYKADIIAQQRKVAEQELAKYEDNRTIE